MQETYIAFHGDSAIKDFYVDRMRRHARADELIQGIYWENGKGCATGCLMESEEPHALFPVKLGVPESIARLEDRIFEGLSNQDAKQFAVDFIEAIPVGADLSLVTARFLLWLLVDEEYGVLQYSDTPGAPVIRQVAALLRRQIAGAAITNEEWTSAAEAAESASESATRVAEAAADAAAAQVADVDDVTQAAAEARRLVRATAWTSGAATAAAWAVTTAADAAWAAVDSAAVDAASDAAEEATEIFHAAVTYTAMAHKLLTLLRDAPVRGGDNTMPPSESNSTDNISP